MKALYNNTVLNIIVLLITPFTESKRGLRVLRKVISNEEKGHRSNEIEIPRIIIAPNADDTIIRDREILKYSKEFKSMNVPTPICEEDKNATFKFNKEFLTCGELADKNEKKIEKICKKKRLCKCSLSSNLRCMYFNHYDASHHNRPHNCSNNHPYSYL